MTEKQTTSVVSQAFDEPEFTRWIVDEVFEGVLKRRPGPQGLSNYPRRLRQEPGFGLKQFIAELIERPEFSPTPERVPEPKTPPPHPVRPPFLSSAQVRAADGSSPTDLSECELILVCPSIKKDCGIGRYTVHVAEACASFFAAVQLLESTYEALDHLKQSTRRAVVLFQHEYSLLDFHHFLAGDDTTASVIANLSTIQSLEPKHVVGVVLHAVVLHDGGINQLNKQWIAAPFPLFHTSREGCSAMGVNHIDLGVPAAPERVLTPPPLPEKFTVGSFGFLAANKDITSLIKLCQNTGAVLRANYAPSSSATREEVDANIDRVLEQVRDAEIEADITFEFMSDGDLREMLRGVSLIYSPQHDFTHHSSSASSRFPMSLGRGVIVPPYRPFLESAPGVMYADLEQASAAVRQMIVRPGRAELLAQIALTYAQQRDYGLIYTDVAKRMLRGDVWCGGFTPELRSRLDEKRSRYKFPVPSSLESRSEQNAKGVRRCGRGLEGGVFAIESPSTAIDAYLNDRSRDLREALRFDRTQDIFSTLATSGDARRDFRHLRGVYPSYISLVELVRLPIYPAALIMVHQLDLSGDECLVLIQLLDEEQSAEKLLVAFGEVFRQKSIGEVPTLTWGHAAVPLRDEMRGVLFPETLLTLPVSTLEKAIGRSVLGRKFNRDEQKRFHADRASGRALADLIWDLHEGESLEPPFVELCGDRRLWRAREHSADDLVQLSLALAPESEKLKAENLRRRDLHYANEFT